MCSCISVNVTATYIGFTAHRYDETDVAFDERIVYETVTANVGSGYDSSTGIFTCPVSGYYYVSVTTFSTVSYFQVHVHVHPRNVVSIGGEFGKLVNVFTCSG